MKLGLAQICTLCMPFIYFITSSFSFTLSFIKKWHSCTNNWLTKSFLPPPFQEHGNRRKNQKFYPNKKWTTIWSSTDVQILFQNIFHPLFIFPTSGLSFLTWPPNGSFSNEKQCCLPSKECFGNRGSWKGKPVVNTLHEGNLIFLLSVYVSSENFAAKKLLISFFCCM